MSENVTVTLTRAQATTAEALLDLHSSPATRLPADLRAIHAASAAAIRAALAASKEGDDV